MKKFFVGCLVVFAGLVVVLIIIIKLTPQEEKDRSVNEYKLLKQQEKDTTAMLVQKVIKRIQLTKSKLPVLTATTAPKRCAPIELALLTLLPSSMTELNQYAENGFSRNSTLYGEPWLTRIMQIINENYAKSQRPEEWDLAEVREASQKILALNYFTVYVPLIYEPPKMLDDKKFESGYFNGWVILVQANTGEPLGYTRFEALSSEKIENSRFKVGIGPLSVPITGKPIEQEMKEDFRNQFFNASYAAIQSMMTEK